MHYSEFVDAGLTGLTELDLFGARITDFGANYLKSKKQYVTNISFLQLSHELNFTCLETEYDYL